MRRWNGWGEEKVNYPLPESAVHFISELIGPGQPPQDATFEDVLKGVPKSQLTKHPSVNTTTKQRLLHARGQSLPDWIALRCGEIRQFPDGVLFPESDEDVQDCIHWASKNGIILIPYGGGTSVVGHINPLPDHRPVLTVNMGRMNQLSHFDSTSMLATFGAGVQGPDLESQLRAHGCTLGHYPQSFEYSTLGGWVATRSTGQQSLEYGRIEKLFAGGTLITPQGNLELQPYPASAAGPDLREIVLGSEGRLGILTRIIVRASPLPAREEFHGVFFPDFSSGVSAVRTLLQSGLHVSMLRLSTAEETRTTLALAGHENLISLLERLLAIRNLGDEKCLLIMGFTGLDSTINYSRKEVINIIRNYSGIHVGKRFGEQWHSNRFRTPYLRNTLWEMGYAIDTLETAVDWSHVPETLTSIENSLRVGLREFDERVHVFTHLSHTYPTGASIYTTYLFRVAPTSAETLHRWTLLKNAASQQIVKHNGTISHQHGIGIDHLPYLPYEKGDTGIGLISAVCRSLDPKGIMNPGKLINSGKEFRT